MARNCEDWVRLFHKQGVVTPIDYSKADGRILTLELRVPLLRVEYEALQALAESIAEDLDGREM